MSTAEPKAKQESKVNFLDFTIKAECWSNVDQLCLLLHKWCKRWVFQLEAGTETGALHYQCRVSLIKKMRVGQAVKELRPLLLNGVDGAWCKITATSKQTVDLAHEDDRRGRDTTVNRGFSYVMKDDTRVEGPWSDQTWDPPIAMTRQLEAFMKCEKRPFQQKIIDLCQRVDERYITYIIEETGGTGKSILTEYICYQRLGVQIPAMKNAEDIMQMVMCIGAKPAYLIDMPRAMKKDNLWELYAGIEAIKNGYAYDKRYDFRQMQFNRPQIIVFSNQFPELSAMSMDRWQIYRIVSNGNPAETDLIQIPIEDYVVEHSVNKAMMAAKLQTEKAQTAAYEEITKCMLSHSEWRDKPRSQFVAEVKRRAASADAYVRPAKRQACGNKDWEAPPGWTDNVEKTFPDIEA